MWNMFKVNNKNTFEYISHLFLLFLLLTLNKLMLTGFLITVKVINQLQANYPLVVWLFSCITRFCKIFGKKLFMSSMVFSLISTSLPFSVKFIPSLSTTLYNKISFTVFQKNIIISQAFTVNTIAGFPAKIYLFKVNNWNNRNVNNTVLFSTIPLRKKLLRRLHLPIVTLKSFSCFSNSH